jgi:phosphoglycolate phosphatase-like HAD superfamily hydrolase
MTYVIFDIDGTLADNTHRAHFIEGPKKNWDAFYGAMEFDEPIEPMLILADILYGEGIDIVLCTGRPDSHQVQTIEWLDNHDIAWTRLYMRKATDHRSDTVVKLELLEQIRADHDGRDPLFVVEDRASMVKTWRKAGLTCLQCADGDF